MTELREPQKVLDRAGGKPVAIMRNSRCVGYLVPEEATLEGAPHFALMDEVLQAARETRAQGPTGADRLRTRACPGDLPLSPGRWF
ncbi:MAG: hypothetical protein ACK5MY_00265 [Jhaorihella sp.]